MEWCQSGQAAHQQYLQSSSRRIHYHYHALAVRKKVFFLAKV
jgi:hypothetical protein